MMTTVTPPSTSVASDLPPMESEHRTPWSYRFWVLFAATALGLAGLAIYGATRSSDPTDAFSWDDEDLSEWITEDEMRDALEDALRLHGDVDGVGEVVLDPLLTQPGEWQWSYRPANESDGWRVMAHDGDHEGRTEDLVLTQTDPRLPEGVVFEPGSGFAHGFYILSGPNSDESICLVLLPAGASYGYPATSELEVHEDRVFALSSVLLRELEWVD